jgi:sulfatase modifying factor 1
MRPALLPFAAGCALLVGGMVLPGCSGVASRGASCPDDMVAIPAGVAVMGIDGRGPDYYRPRREIQQEGYCIDKYEWPNKEGELPQSNVSWDEADAACREVGKRLCTELEWARACRGPEGRKYSYGNQRDPMACNTPIQGSGPGKHPAPIKPSGAFPRCVTPEGVYDLNGSLSEWVSDPWDGGPEPFNREATVDPETWRTLRGGTMWFSTFSGQECMSRHGHRRSTFRNIDDGFRCCRDAG